MNSQHLGVDDQVCAFACVAVDRQVEVSLPSLILGCIRILESLMVAEGMSAALALYLIVVQRLVLIALLVGRGRSIPTLTHRGRGPTAAPAARCVGRRPARIGSGVHWGGAHWGWSRCASVCACAWNAHLHQTRI